MMQGDGDVAHRSRSTPDPQASWYPAPGPQTNEENGMNAYRRIIATAKQRMAKGGRTTGAPAVHSPFEILETRPLMAAVPTIVAPANVSVTTISDAALNVSWTDTPDNATQVVVERSVGGGRFKPVATLPADSSTFSDSSL